MENTDPASFFKCSLHMNVCFWVLVFKVGESAPSYMYVFCYTYKVLQAGRLTIGFRLQPPSKFIWKVSYATFTDSTAPGLLVFIESWWLPVTNDCCRLDVAVRDYWRMKTCVDMNWGKEYTHCCSRLYGIYNNEFYIDGTPSFLLRFSSKNVNWKD